MVYVCGMCGTEFSTVSEGLMCEQSHKETTLKDLLEPFDDNYGKVDRVHLCGERIH